MTSQQYYFAYFMSTYILIHGSWHGAWCWHKVIPLLEASGHKVIAPDLPAHGHDRTPIADISLNSYVECIDDILVLLSPRVKI